MPACHLLLPTRPTHARTRARLVIEEQFLAVQLDSVRDPDITYVAAGPCGADGLHHRLLRAYAFQHRVGADAARQVHNARDSLVAALGRDVGCAEFACELLPLVMPAHRYYPLG